MEIESLIDLEPKTNIPEISPGDTVKVSFKIKERDRERIQVFQGVVTGVSNGKIRSNFTVRRVTYGIGVERTFFINSPLLEKVEIARRGSVRRARLYYLRGLSGKATRIKEKRDLAKSTTETTAAVEDAPVAVAESEQET